jgi:Mechanosensitive ion channel, conserved TM helix
MQPFIEQLTQTLGSQVPQMVGAVALLAIGWIIANIIASMTKKLIHQLTLDRRLAEVFFPGEALKAVEIQKWAGNGVFYLLMLLVLIAVFETLQLRQVNEPLNGLLTQVFEFLPRLVSALLLLGIAWIIATVLKVGIRRILEVARFDERFQDQTESGAVEIRPLSNAIGETVYWLIFLLFLPAVLGALAVEGLLDPVKGMTDTLLGYVPNLFAAGLILFIGYLVAGVVQRIVTNILGAAGADRLSERVGLAPILGSQRISQVLGLIVYVLIFIPVIIGALNALALDAITRPASNMLDTMLGILPDLFGATLIVTVAFVVGRVLAGLASNVLAGLGFNNILVRVGLSHEQSVGTKTPSEVIGSLILTIILLFATIEAAELLGLQLLATLVSDLTVFGGHLLVGLVVFAIGLFLANVAAKTIQSSSMAQALLLAKVARLGVIVLASAMALLQMGLANEIVNLAFGLTLGALAVAFALAFGLGGREVAASELKLWIEQIRSKSGKG